MKKIQITVYLVERDPGVELGLWGVTHDETDTVVYDHDLTMGVARCVADLFQKKAMKALGQ